MAICSDPRLHFTWAILIFILIAQPSATAENRDATGGPTVRVGVYENKPKVFVNEQGEASGIFIDILRHIAQKENWQLEFVPGTWAEGLQRLVDGEIDLMPDVAFSEKRSKIYEFNKVPVLSSWFHVYAHESETIESMLDLAGKRVLVLKGSIQEDVFRDMAKGFDLQCEINAVDNYKKSLELLDAHEADALILNRFYGKEHASPYRVKETSILFHPTRLYYAAPKGRTGHLDAVDKRLKTMKSDTGSAYYQVIEFWLKDAPAVAYPRILGYIFLALIAVSVLAVAGTLLLKWQVKRRTQELHRSEQNYREVFNGTNESIIIHDAQTLEILDVNQTMLDQFGYPNREEVLKLSVGDISANRSPYTAEDAKRWMLKAGEEGTQLVDWRCKRADGSEFDVEVGITTTEIDGQRRFLAAIRDVSKRTEAQQALKESERKFRSLTETLAAFVVLVQGDEIVYTNPAAEKILGFPPEHFIGMKYYEPIHPDDQEAMIQRRQQREEGFAGLNRYDARLLHADGSYRWIDFSTLMTEFDGRPSTLVTGFDVTERKQAEEALALSETRWRDMYTQSPVMLTSVNEAGNITEVSNYLCKKLGYDREDFIGKSSMADAPPSVLERLGQTWERLIAEAEAKGSMPPVLKKVFAGFQEMFAEFYSGNYEAPPVLYTEDSVDALEQGLKDYFQKAQDGGDLSEFFNNAPVRLRKKDGGTIDVLETNIFEFDEDYKVRGMFKVSVDITEEKRAVDALRKSEERFRKLYGKTPVMVVALNQEGIIKEISNYWCEVLGYEVGEVIGKNGLEFFSEESKASILERRARTLAGEEVPEVVRNIPVQMVKKGGGIIDVLMTYLPETDDDGVTGGMLGIAIDVTEEKRANEALRESEERWRKMYTEAPVMMCAVDRLGRIQEVSDVWCQTLGYSRDEMIGMHRSAFFPRELLEKTFEAFKSYLVRTREKGILDPGLETFMEAALKLDVESVTAMESPDAWLNALSQEMCEEGKDPSLSIITEECGDQIRGVWDQFLAKLEEGEGMPESIRNFPLKLRKKNGHTLDVLMTKIFVREDSGEIGGAFIVGVDVTEEKQLQAQLLHQDKIAAVGMLAAGVAHEIGNPLSALSMAAQSLQRKTKDEYAVKKLGLISTHIDRISKIVQQMSDLARAPNEKQSRCEANSIIERAVDIVRYDKRAKRSEIELSLAPRLPAIMAVEDHLMQVFINLMLNAVDALESNPEGKPRRMTVSSESFASEDFSGLRIVFQDTGPGISPEDLTKIFQPFFTTKEVGRGTGLGLAVSYRIVQEHGGRINAESSLGQGTRFTIDLPGEDRP